MKKLPVAALTLLNLCLILLFTLAFSVPVQAQDVPQPTPPPTANLAIPLPGGSQTSAPAPASQASDSASTQSTVNQNNLEQGRIRLDTPPASTPQESTNPTVRTGGLPLVAMFTIPMVIVAVYAYSYYKKTKKALHTEEIRITSNLNKSK